MANVIVHNINSEKFEVDSESLIFNPAVYGVIIKQDKILLLPTQNKYALPGGSIESGENHITALKREVLEETGLHIKPTKILNVYTSLYKSFKSGTNYHCIQLFYICELADDKAEQVHFTPDEQKYLKPAEWKPVSELESLEYIGAEPVFADIINEFKK